jgi:hypothetical protein
MVPIDCTSLAKVVGAPLPALQVSDYSARCFEDAYQQPDGTLALPTKDQPQTGSIVYADPSIDPMRDSAQDIIDGGGVFVAGGAQLLNSTAPPSGSIKANETQAVAIDGDTMTVVRRVADARVVAIWWDTVAGLDRVLEWNVFTAGTPDEALALAREAQASS